MCVCVMESINCLHANLRYSGMQRTHLEMAYCYLVYRMTILKSFCSYCIYLNIRQPLYTVSNFQENANTKYV